MQGKSVGDPCWLVAVGQYVCTDRMEATTIAQHGWQRNCFISQTFWTNSWWFNGKNSQRDYWRERANIFCPIIPAAIFSNHGDCLQRFPLGSPALDLFPRFVQSDIPCRLSLPVSCRDILLHVAQQLKATVCYVQCSLTTDQCVLFSEYNVVSMRP